MNEFLNMTGGAACSAVCVVGGIVVLVLLVRVRVVIEDVIYSNQMEQYRQYIIRTGRSITFYEWKEERKAEEKQAYMPGKEVS